MLTHGLIETKALFPQPTQFFKQYIGDEPFEILLNSAIVIAAAYLAWRFILEPIYTALIGIWNFWRHTKQQAQVLEITPPKQIEIAPLATQELFAIIERLTGNHGVMSLEITSSRKNGIRYLIRATSNDIPVLQRHLAAHLPDARFKVLNDADQLIVTEGAAYYRVHEIKQPATMPTP